MFIGHFAVGLTAKKISPKVNVAIYIIACQMLDIIWPVLVLLGVEKVSVDPKATAVTPLNFEHYPYSHSLIMSLGYSLVFGFIGHLYFKSKKIALTIGAVVFSHWILDFITHRPDLPILFADMKVGLGLWNSLFFTVLVEVSLFFIGIYFYLKSVTINTRGQKIAFWSFIIFLLLVYVGNIFGPKPNLETSGVVIAAPALSMWLLVIWAYFFDRIKS